ncbi:MAG: thiosulfate dehydrogenase (quinone) large subunit [Solirubrobacteraceae bacterium]
MGVGERSTPALALLPLRAFLGATFVYAGVQKLSDPGFLHAGAPTYIGSQLRGFSQGTPGGFLLRTFALPHAQLAGVAVAVTEIGVGLLVLLGLAIRLAAVVGLGLNLVLFLTASWKTSPYFLGSDIVFVFAWLPFVIAGGAGQPTLEGVLARRARRVRAAEPGARLRTRRESLAAAWGAVAAGTLSIAGASALLKGTYGGGSRTLAGLGGAVPRPRRRSRHTTSQKRLPAGAVLLGASSRLARGTAALYRDPSDGRADIVVRQSDGRLTSHSAICTHAGCQVQYTNGTLFCPCHSSVFNSKTGAVEQGPANQPLPVKRVVERGGRIYAVPS